MKKIGLSIFASAALVATIFTGCGSSGSSSASSVRNAADGYVINLNSPATAVCGEKDYSTDVVGDKGKLIFTGVNLDKDCVITVPADANIDVNNNGTYEPAIDKEVGFPLKASGDAKYVSQLTTLVQAKRDSGDTAGADALAVLVNDFDPVEAASTVASSSTSAENKVKFKNLMILSEVAKTVLSSSTTTAASKIDTKDFIADTVIDTAKITSSVSAPELLLVKSVVKQKAKVIADVVEVLETIDTTKVDLNTLVTNISDGGETLSEAVVKSVKEGTTVTATTLDTVVKAGTTANLQDTASTVDTEVGNANNEIAALPPKLNLGTVLKAGSKNITLNGDSFTTTISSANANLSDFFSVSLPSASLSKDVSSLSTQTVSLSIELIDKDNTGDTAKLKVEGIELSLKAVDSNEIKITIPMGASVIASQTGLTGLSTISDGSTVTAATGSALENDDFSFNVNTLIAEIGGTEIGTAIAELNTYFKQANVYTVKISLEGLNDLDVIIDNNVITGTVTVTK